MKYTKLLFLVFVACFFLLLIPGKSLAAAHGDPGSYENPIPITGPAGDANTSWTVQRVDVPGIEYWWVELPPFIQVTANMYVIYSIPSQPVLNREYYISQMDATNRTMTVVYMRDMLA